MREQTSVAPARLDPSNVIMRQSSSNHSIATNNEHDVYDSRFFLLKKDSERRETLVTIIKDFHEEVCRLASYFISHTKCFRIDCKNLDGPDHS